MQYEGSDLFRRIVIGSSMEGGKGNGHNHPVLIGIGTIDQDNDDGYQEKQQQQTPAFPDLYQYFIEIFLNEIASEHKRNDQPDDTEGYQQGGWHSRNGENNMWNDIIPIPVTGQIQQDKKEVIGESKTQ